MLVYEKFALISVYFGKRRRRALNVELMPFAILNKRGHHGRSSSCGEAGTDGETNRVTHEHEGFWTEWSDEEVQDEGWVYKYEVVPDADKMLV